MRSFWLVIDGGVSAPADKGSTAGASFRSITAGDVAGDFTQLERD